MFELLSGTHVPENFKTIATLSVLIALFYGAAYVKDLVVHVTTDSKNKKQLSAMIKDLSDRTGQTEDQIRKFLDKRYKPKSKLKIIGDAAFKFFKPSKSQPASPIRVNNREISHDLVLDVPQSYTYEQIMDEQSARPFPRVQLELHAQDRGREASGWAAIAHGSGDKRLNMKLVDGVSPDQLWGRDHIQRDIITKDNTNGLCGRSLKGLML
jgi:hypothetical protein